MPVSGFAAIVTGALVAAVLAGSSTPAAQPVSTSAHVIAIAAELSFCNRIGGMASHGSTPAPVAAAMASGTTGTAAPRIRVTVFPVLLADHTLPEMSTAIPAGVALGPQAPVDSVPPDPQYPPVGDTAVPALLSTLTVPFAFATHTCPTPSTAIARGSLTPPVVIAVELIAAPCRLNSLTPFVLATHTSPDASNARPSAFAIVPSPAPV